MEMEESHQEQKLVMPVRTNENVVESPDTSFKRPSCKWYIDRAFYCVSPINQLTHFYRDGTLDSCNGTWSNMFQCFRSSQMDDEKAKAYLAKSDIDPNKPHHRADVWEYKQAPGW